MIKPKVQGLTVTRKLGDEIFIAVKGETIRIEVCGIEEKTVKLLFDANEAVKIWRPESFNTCHTAE